MSFKSQLGQEDPKSQFIYSEHSSKLSRTVSNFKKQDLQFTGQTSHKSASSSFPNTEDTCASSHSTMSHSTSSLLQNSGLPSASAQSTPLLFNQLLPTSASSIYLTLNSSGIVLSVNPSGAASLGYGTESLIGQSVMSLFHPSDRMRLWTELGIVVAESLTNSAKFCLLDREGASIEHIVTLQSFQTIREPGTLLICTPLNTQVSQKIYRLEQAQAEQVLRQQTEWDRLMRSLAQLAYQSLELRFILQTIAKEVRQLLQADRVLFYQTHSSKTGSILTESFAPTGSSILHYPEATAVFQQKCAQLQALLMNPDSHQSCPVLKTDNTIAGEEFGVQSEVVIPIVEKNHLWGLIVVRRYHLARQWQLWELGLLKQLAIYLNGVIQQAGLYQKVQRLNAELERQVHARTAELQLAFEFEATLKRITDNVRDSLNENEILETVVQELACAIGTNCCNASIYNLEAGTSTICYEYTTVLSAYQGRVVQLDASPEIYSQLLKGESFQFCSLNINPVRGKVSMFTCPIVDDQGILGDLWLINQPYYCFTAQDIRLVQQVANQCAIALRQARLYQAAQAQVKELERLNQLKDDFLSTVSHELRTPMANIKMATQMLEVVLRQAGVLLKGNDCFRATKYFQILQAECQREINLINDLLDLSRLDTEQVVLQHDTIDIPGWLTTIAQPFLSRIQEQQQQLKLDYSPQLPSLTTDLSSLERIITELLQNACKYTPSGETITISARLSQRGSVTNNNLIHTDSSTPLSLAPSTLLLSITNSGVEIPPDELSQVFEKFYRIPNNDPWQHGGTGLGLALVKKLTERLGGAIWAASSSRQTHFTIELPLL